MDNPEQLEKFNRLMARLLATFEALIEIGVSAMLTQLMREGASPMVLSEAAANLRSDPSLMAARPLLKIGALIAIEEAAGHEAETPHLAVINEKEVEKRLRLAFGLHVATHVATGSDCGRLRANAGENETAQTLVKLG